MKEWAYWRKVLIAGVGGIFLYLIVGSAASLEILSGMRVNFEFVALGLAAGVGGPIAGLFTGLLGETFLGLTIGAVSFSRVLACGLLGLLLGLGCRDMMVAEGYYGWRDIGRFMVFSVLSVMAAFLCLYPVLEIFAFNGDIVVTIIESVAYTGLSMLVLVLLGPVFMWITSMIVYVSLGLYYGDLKESAEEKKARKKGRAVNTTAAKTNKAKAQPAKIKHRAVADETPAAKETEDDYSPQDADSYQMRDGTEEVTKMLNLSSWAEHGAKEVTNVPVFSRAEKDFAQSAEPAEELEEAASAPQNPPQAVPQAAEQNPDLQAETRSEPYAEAAREELFAQNEPTLAFSAFEGVKTESGIEKTGGFTTI